MSIEAAIETKKKLEGLRAATDRANQPFACYFVLAKPVNADTLRRYEDAGIDHFRAPISAGVSERATIQQRKDNLERFAETIAAAGYRLEPAPLPPNTSPTN